MTPLKIGFLTPYSGIYPEMSHHVVYGLLMPFIEYSQRGKQLFHIEPEYVKLGGTAAVKDAVQKLIFFDGVDIVSGFPSYVNIPDILPLIEKQKKMAFFFDSGEYIPHTPQLSPNIFYNSFQLWQTEYALGQWAHQEFGGKGIIAMGIYDSGYHLHSAFQQGAAQAGAEAVDIAVLGQPNQGGDVPNIDSYIKEFIKKAEASKPDYVHAIFCGDEASKFIVEYHASSLRGQVPLILSSHMASDEIIDPIIHLDQDVYSASLWNNQMQNSANQKFVKTYMTNMGKKPNMFNLLGFEVGLLFREISNSLEKRDWDAVRNTLQKKSIRGPRGSVNFYPKSGFDIPSIAIEKLRIRNSKNTRMIVGQGEGLKYDNEVFDRIHQAMPSGWKNPYFCV
ncbi:MAG: ABC transporter substrate-binding protein [Bacteroidota bacterium]